MPCPFYYEGFYLYEFCQALNIFRIALPVFTTHMHLTIEWC